MMWRGSDPWTVEDAHPGPHVGMILDRIAGILLTSIAVVLLANGFTDLVRARL